MRQRSGPRTLLRKGAERDAKGVVTWNEIAEAANELFALVSMDANRPANGIPHGGLLPRAIVPLPPIVIQSDFVAAIFTMFPGLLPLVAEGPERPRTAPGNRYRMGTSLHVQEGLGRSQERLGSKPPSAPRGGKPSFKTVHCQLV